MLSSLSPENNPPPPVNHKTSTPPLKPPQEQPLKCPRCDSSNTKFCYYNNYSLTQPRHFCKTCRRYWTRGGALRNVPIGGGCRKPTKKFKITTPNPATSKLFPGGGGFPFMNPNPAMEFNPPAGGYTQLISSSGPTPYFGLNLMDLNYSLSLPSPAVGGNEPPISISSIESLSSINQEMHWKLQQQRLAMFYATTSSKNDDEHKAEDDDEEEEEKGEVEGAINLLNNKQDMKDSGDTARKIDHVGPIIPTEWLFDQIQTSSPSPGNYGGNDDGGNNNGENVVDAGSLNGVWGDLLDHNHHQRQFHFNGLH